MAATISWETLPCQRLVFNGFDLNDIGCDALFANFRRAGDDDDAVIHRITR